MNWHHYSTLKTRPDIRFWFDSISITVAAGKWQVCHFSTGQKMQYSGAEANKASVLADLQMLRKNIAESVTMRSELLLTKLADLIDDFKALV